MSWAKIDDGWWCHRKTMGLPLASAGLYALALSWSCAQRSPIVPTTFLPMVGGTDADASPLVERGSWHVVDGGWEIHDWAEYQELSVSEKRAEAGRKGGSRKPATSTKSKQTEAKPKQTSSKSDLASEANAQAGALPDPSRPVPSRPIENSSSVSEIQSPPPAVIAETPPTKLTGQALEQATNRSLLRWSNTVAAASADHSPSGFARTLRADAAHDGNRATLEAWIADGVDPDDAADRLAADGGTGNAGTEAERAAAHAAAKAREQATTDALAAIAERPTTDHAAHIAAIRGAGPDPMAVGA
jgi:hypothetical protein